MSTYYTNEAAFELPDDELGALVDRTVHVLEGETPSGGELGVVALRTRIPTGKSLLDLVRLHEDHERRALRAYAVLGEDEVEIDDGPALRVRASWRGESGMVFQEQAHLARRGLWLVFSVTAPLEERQLATRTMDRLTSTLHTRKEP
jgi:hypothetical protein